MAILGVKTIIGVFASPAAAEEAAIALREAGVPESRMAISATLTEDGIGAESPGQSFENQPGQPQDRDDARFAQAVRGGTCVLSVFARSDEEMHLVQQLLRQKHAYRTAIRP
jgi:hypothetical protein